MDALAHSRTYEAALPRGGRVLDLGSGAGVPGLVVAWDRADLAMTLLDVRQKRADQLERLVRRLGLGTRVSVVCARADHFTASEPGAFTAVIARRFGPPAAVARAADTALGPGGVIVVSAAPDDRWDGLAAWSRSPAPPPGLEVLHRSFEPT